jgi:hypothetical protein
MSCAQRPAAGAVARTAAEESQPLARRGYAQPLPRDEQRAVECIALLEPPDPLAGISRVEPRRDRPERVVRPDDVRPLRPRALRRVRDHAPENQGRYGDEEDTTEHLFV